jgi:long-chain acyl-CoA synthetase
MNNSQRIENNRTFITLFGKAMNDNELLTFPALFGKALEKYGDQNALAFVDESPLSYKEVNDWINALIRFLEDLEIKKGDRVALLGTNMPHWGIAYFAIAFMGAVVVPLLPDFLPNEIGNILDHAEAKAILVSESLMQKMKNVKDKSLLHIIRLEDFKLTGDPMPGAVFNLVNKPINHYDVKEDDLAAIIYTSGTTGSSKGVMLTHKNISFTALAGRKLKHVDESDRFLSILPLSHTLENTVGFLIPIFNGACVYYLKKTPSPSVLIPALQKVKPTIMLSVPMVIEKIYYNRVYPALNGKWYIKILMTVPPIRKKLHQVAGKKLLHTFGGELQFFGIGGAKLNGKVEQFLAEAGFPYAIGYGLTETAPLLAGAVVGETRLGSTGKAIEGVELKINDPDPATGEGEIWARGPNVMKGYYKEPALTGQVLTRDGWFKTGDLGVFDGDQKLYIKGRMKNIIVGSSGENIYPEEIESVINDFRHVIESIVIQKKGKLVALVHLNREEIEEAYHHLREEVSQFADRKTEEILRELKIYVNARVNKFSRLHNIVLQQDPFQKTATKKIKRFLYI